MMLSRLSRHGRSFDPVAHYRVSEGLSAASWTQAVTAAALQAGSFVDVTVVMHEADVPKRSSVMTY
jgi:hypothetical protein